MIFLEPAVHMLENWGPTFWVPSSPYMTASFHVMQYPHQITDHLKGSILSRCLQEYQRVTTALAPSLTSSIFFAQEVQGECIVLCTPFLSLPFRTGALPQHQHRSHKPMTSNLLSHQVQKKRIWSESSALQPSRSQMSQPQVQSHWFWKTSLLGGMSSYNAGALTLEGVLQWLPLKISSLWQLLIRPTTFRLKSKRG